MFDEIAALAAAKCCTFTLYVDDMTITGQFATRAMQKEARAIIGRYRLKAHKTKIFSHRQPRIVTGVAITARGPELPNRRARKRSEEHTSELQSLMRISYAVFCLKKKRKKL